MRRVDEAVQELGRGIGHYIREQRKNAQLSLRQLARLAGVSNPYLSQVERGLRNPSAQILQQIAKALRISAEVLYVQAGILDQRTGGPVVDAIVADTHLSERQKQALLDVYEAFRQEHAARSDAARSDAARSDAAPAVAPQSPADRAALDAAVTIMRPQSGKE